MDVMEQTTIAATDVFESKEENVAMKVSTEKEETVEVLTMSGKVLTTVSPVPATVLELKQAIFERVSVPVALQKLLGFDGANVYEDGTRLDSSASMSVLMVKDETAMFTWDLENNPSSDQLQLEGPSTVTCQRMRTDYINVLTKEPIRNGVHYFEFVMHYIGDEQSCGLVADPRHAGPAAGLRYLKGWTYYCGRVGSGYSGSLKDGKGALHALGTAVVEFKKLQTSGDVIGVLVDMDVGAVAFDLNGELQGACAIATDRPLYCLTHLDTSRDKVELRKPCLQDAPPANLEALQGALLDIAKGEKLHGFRWDD
mmetsp:Transcript_141464/g.257101  ORF Transcript_141464/g.257101 Transcript_141464/m.257101 type:complete len:312 (-) Transcript_141464:143-1078(-)